VCFSVRMGSDECRTLRHTYATMRISEGVNIFQLAANMGTLPSLYAVRILYFVRNYLVDGAFPFMLAAFALAAIFQLIDLHWLRAWIPTPRMP
jgi:hypothetical protein